MTTLGIGLALACAAMANLSMLLQAPGGVRVAGDSLRSPIAAPEGTVWLALVDRGFAVAAVAWVLHVAAMAIAPLSLVQA